MNLWLLYGGVVGITAVIWLLIQTSNNKLHQPRIQAAKEHGWRYEKLGNTPRFRLSGVAEGIHWQLLPEARRSIRYLWTTQTPLSSDIAITIRPKEMPKGSTLRMGFAGRSMQATMKRVQTFQQDGKPLVQTMVMLGSEQFQCSFYVWSSDETAVINFLDLTMQQHLLAWTKNQGKQAAPEIILSPTNIRIIVTMQLTAARMDDFVKLGEIVIGRYKAIGEKR